jgi:drug/metabolite transporter (DMT)-like permease
MNESAGLNFQSVALIVGTIAMLAVGQVLFKYAAATLNFGDVRSFVTVPLFCALTIYGVAPLAWLGVLTRVPLSVAFPFYGLSFILVPVLSALILGEKLRMSTLVGGVIIMVGIVVSSKRW